MHLKLKIQTSQQELLIVSKMVLLVVNFKVLAEFLMRKIDFMDFDGKE